MTAPHLDQWDLEQLSKKKENKKKLMEIGLVTRKGDPDLSFLKGKLITDIGFIGLCKIEGGLTIDYCDGNETKRLILGFNELGSWIIANF